MKTKHGVFIAGLLVCMTAFQASADPLPPFGTKTNVPVLKTVNGLKTYDVNPKDDLSGNFDYFVNKGRDKVGADDLGDALPMFRPEDVKKYGLHCDYLCANAAGDIVGHVVTPVDERRLAKAKGKK